MDFRKGTRVKSLAFGEGVVEVTRGNMLGVRFSRGAGFMTLNADLHPLEILAANGHAEGHPAMTRAVETEQRSTPVPPALSKSRKERTMPKGMKVETEEVARLYQSGMSAKAIAEQIGCRESSIYHHLHKAGVRLAGRRGVKTAGGGRKPRALRLVKPKSNGIGKEWTPPAPVASGHPYAGAIADLESRAAKLLAAAVTLREIGA